MGALLQHHTHQKSNSNTSLNGLEVKTSARLPTILYPSKNCWAGYKMVNEFTQQ
jgi:hypothetical protein